VSCKIREMVGFCSLRAGMAEQYSLFRSIKHKGMSEETGTW